MPTALITTLTSKSGIGFPAIKRAKSALELSNSDLWPLQQTIHAVNNLKAAVLSSALAFVAGVVAVGFAWLAPNAAAPAVTVNLMIRPPTPSPGAAAAAERALASLRCRRSWWRGRVEPGSVRDKTSDESWPSF